MTPFLRERRSKHFLIGGHGWDKLSPEYVSRFESIFSELGLASSSEVTTMFLTVQESLLYMMAADVVDDHLPLPRDSLATGLEKLREPLARRQRDVNLAE